MLSSFKELNGFQGGEVTFYKIIDPVPAYPFLSLSLHPPLSISLYLCLVRHLSSKCSRHAVILQKRYNLTFSEVLQAAYCDNNDRQTIMQFCIYFCVCIFGGTIISSWQQTEISILNYFCKNNHFFFDWYITVPFCSKEVTTAP